MADHQATGHKRGASEGGSLAKRLRTDDNEASKSQGGDTPTKPELDGTRDEFCWYCHREGTNMVCCLRCPRVYHTRCLSTPNNAATQNANTSGAAANATLTAAGTTSNSDVAAEAAAAPPASIVCMECERIEEAQRNALSSLAMQEFPPERLSKLLLYVTEYLKDQALPEFKAPVDTTKVRDYRTYIVNPLDLGTIEQRVRSHSYVTTTMFHSDLKWLVHNSMVYNGSSHRLTKHAKHLEKLTRQEMLEIEMCPDCYARFTDGLRESSFSEPCAVPHVLVWARMRGYPFWPAKVMRETDHHVDVRFFGDHERAQVAMSAVQLLSKLIPVPKGQRTDQFQASCQELLIHVKRLRAKYGYFEYAPPETMYSREKAAYFREVLTDPTLRNRYEELFPAGATPAQQISALPPSLRAAASKTFPGSAGSSASKATSRTNLNDASNQSALALQSSSTALDNTNAEDVEIKGSGRKRNNGSPFRSRSNASVATKDLFDRPTSSAQSRSQTSVASASPKQQSSAADLILKRLKVTGDPSQKVSEDSFGGRDSPPHRTTIVEPNSTDFANDEDDDGDGAGNAGETDPDVEEVDAPPENRNDRERDYDDCGDDEQEDEVSAFNAIRSSRERSSGGKSSSSAAYFFQKLQRTIAACQEFGIDASQQRTVDDSLTVMEFDDDVDKRDKSTSRNEAAATAVAAASAAATGSDVASNSAPLSNSEKRRRAAIQRERIDLLRLVNGLFDTLLFVDDCASKAKSRREAEVGDPLAMHCEQSAAAELVSSSAVEIALRERNEELANENAALRALHGQIKLELIRLMHTALTELQADTQQRAKQHVDAMRRQIEAECALKIEANKRKQWCAHCLKEATLYCCWNVAYCSYACQRLNWPQHMNSCQQMAASKQLPQIGAGNSAQMARSTMVQYPETTPKVISVGNTRVSHQGTHQLMLPSAQQVTRVGNTHVNAVPPLPRYGIVTQPSRVAAVGAPPSSNMSNVIVRSSSRVSAGSAIGRVSTGERVEPINLQHDAAAQHNPGGMVVATMRSSAGSAGSIGNDKNA